MTIINTFNDTISTNVPDYPQIKGHILGKKAILSFGRLEEQMVYGYRLFEFDAEISRKRVTAEVVKINLVNPDYFVYDGEEYKVEE